MAEKKGWLSTAFIAVAAAIAVDLLLVFPISHTSILGGIVTKWSGSMVVPPLDWFATDVLGIHSTAGSMAAGGGTVTAGALPAALPAGIEGAVAPPPPVTPGAEQAVPVDRGTSLESLTGSTGAGMESMKSSFFDSSIPAANDSLFAPAYSMAA